MALENKPGITDSVELAKTNMVYAIMEVTNRPQRKASAGCLYTGKVRGNDICRKLSAGF